MSDTPRTTEAYQRYQGMVRAHIASGPLLDLARTIERENAELLAALEAIEKHVTGMGGIDRVDLLAICAHVKRDARAAIAKAKP